MGAKSQNKKPKSQVIFDEEKRANYLLGFRKRKQERKVKAREELDAKIKEEKRRQRELKAQAYLAKHGKIDLPTIENKLTKKQVIDTSEHTIIVSDLSGSMPCNKFSDSEAETEENKEIKEAEQKDAEIFKSQSKISKECSLIDERLSKLEKHKKSLEKSNTKLKKNLKTSRVMAKKFKASKKFQIKDTKFKTKTKLKLKKKLDKKK